MGARPAKHRAFVLYRPRRELTGWLVILGCMCGLLIAAAQEAADIGDPGWATAILVLLGADLILYWWVVLAWVRWLD